MEKDPQTTPVPPPAAAPKIETPPQGTNAAETEPAYVFPEAAKKGACTHLDKASGVFWIGFSLTLFSYEEAALWLDSKKFDILRLYMQIASAKQQREEMQKLQAKSPRRIGQMMADLGRKIMH